MLFFYIHLSLKISWAPFEIWFKPNIAILQCDFVCECSELWINLTFWWGGRGTLVHTLFSQWCLLSRGCFKTKACSNSHYSKNMLLFCHSIIAWTIHWLALIPSFSSQMVLYQKHFLIFLSNGSYCSDITTYVSK